MTATVDKAAETSQSRALSSLFAGIAAGEFGDKITLGGVVVHLGGQRSFAAVLFVLGLFAWLPIWPVGFASVFGVASLGLAVQMVAGRPQPMIPRRILAIGLRTERAQGFARRVLPWIQRAEHAIRPRRLALTGLEAQRWLGSLILVLGLVICVPLPMTNSPPGAAMVVLALGLMARDGIFVLIGLGFSAAALAVVTAFWTAMWLGVGWALEG